MVKKNKGEEEGGKAIELLHILLHSAILPGMAF